MLTHSERFATVLQYEKWSFRGAENIDYSSPGYWTASVAHLYRELQGHTTSIFSTEGRKSPCFRKALNPTYQTTRSAWCATKCATHDSFRAHTLLQGRVKAVYGADAQRHSPPTSPPGKWPGGWVGFRVCLDRCGIPRLHRYSISGQSSP